MKKSDLKVGYVVQTRKGDLGMVMPYYDGGDDCKIVVDDKGYKQLLADWDEDLTDIEDNKEYDIIAVYGYAEKQFLSIGIDDRDLLWKREEDINEAVNAPASSSKPYTLSVNDFAQEIHKNAVEHGWWDEERRFGEIVALCHSELSEALEEYRNGNPNVYFYENAIQSNPLQACLQTDLDRLTDQKLEGIAVEMIDCIIRILDWCAKEGVDIEDIMLKKHEFNRTRPHKHGGKKI